MNRDAMLVALGVGVGALISTEQGRTIIGSLSKAPLMQAIGEGTVNLFKNMGEKENNGAAPEISLNQAPQQSPQAENMRADGEEKGV